MEFINDSFEEEVCMYINDCMQYLKTAENGSREVNMLETLFESTDNHEEIIKGMKRLKDMCIRLSGGTPLKWETEKVRDHE